MIKREFWEKVAECWGKKEETKPDDPPIDIGAPLPSWVMDDGGDDDMDIDALFSDGEIEDLNDFINMFANSDDDEIDVTAYFS